MEDCARHLGHCMVDMRELSATPEELTAAGELTTLAPITLPFHALAPQAASCWRLSASRCIFSYLFIIFLLAVVVSVRVSEGVGLFRRWRGQAKVGDWQDDLRCR